MKSHVFVSLKKGVPFYSIFLSKLFEVTWPQSSFCFLRIPSTLLPQIKPRDILSTLFPIIVHLQTSHSVRSVMECATAGIVINKTNKSNIILK
jgi:hypothetical protein